VPRLTPCMRAYRALTGLNVTMSVPPLPVVVEETVVQVAPSDEVWIRRGQAVQQDRTAGRNRSAARGGGRGHRPSEARVHGGTSLRGRG
jgi:hypothetical protein